MIGCFDSDVLIDYFDGIAMNVIKKNDPIPEYPEPIKTVELSFEPADISFFLLQVL